MSDLKITTIQSELHWENIDANLSMFDEKLSRIEEPTDIVILPEMFTTGFSMNAKNLAQTMSGSAATWLKEKSRDLNADIIGGVIIEENDCFYNRLLWAKPDGTLLFYDKRHLFRFAGEDKVYTPGDKTIIVEANGWKIKPFVCYDLRFPIWSRNLNKAYDAAVYIANWPQKRSAHWNALLLARAIENQVYVVGVNRVGEDGNGHYYSGDSSIIGPSGNILYHKKDAPDVNTLTLVRNELETYRNGFPAWMDADADMVVER